MCRKSGFVINADMKQLKNQNTETQLAKAVTREDFKFGTNANVESGFIRKK